MMGAHVPHALWRAFDTECSQEEDGCMDEISRLEMDARTELIKAWVYQRLAERQQEKSDRHTFEFIQWLIGIQLACMAIVIIVFGLMLNLAVTALAANTRPHHAPSLHRFQRHHQARPSGGDARRHELHTRVAQVVHLE
jgi:hypothetical protein